MPVRTFKVLNFLAKHGIFLDFITKLVIFLECLLSLILVRAIENMTAW